MNVREFIKGSVPLIDANISEIVKAGPMYAVYFEPHQGFTSLFISEGHLVDYHTGEYKDIVELSVHKNIYFITCERDWIMLHCIYRKKSKMRVYLMSASSPTPWRSDDPLPYVE